MLKSKLKTGMVVVTRDGKVGLVLNDILCGINWWNPLSFYDENLKTPRYKFEGEIDYSRGGQSDIMEVYTVENVGITLESLLDAEKIKEFGKRLK